MTGRGVHDQGPVSMRSKRAAVVWAAPDRSSRPTLARAARRPSGLSMRAEASGASGGGVQPNATGDCSDAADSAAIAPNAWRSVSGSTARFSAGLPVRWASRAWR